MISDDVFKAVVVAGLLAIVYVLGTGLDRIAKKLDELRNRR